MGIRDKIYKHFSKNELGFERLLEIIEKQLDEVHVLSEAPTDPSPLDVQSGKELVLSLPKFSPH